MEFRGIFKHFSGFELFLFPSSVHADLARDAESAGWDGFFLWDHIARHGDDGCTLPHSDPWLALTAAAMQTTSIILGTTVTPLPHRRPHQLARETVTLDRLSSGRLILGVGIGVGQTWWLEVIMPEAYGFHPTDPHALAVMRTRVMQGPPGAG